MKRDNNARPYYNFVISAFYFRDDTHKFELLISVIR